MASQRNLAIGLVAIALGSGLIFIVVRSPRQGSASERVEPILSAETRPTDVVAPGSSATREGVSPAVDRKEEAETRPASPRGQPTGNESKGTREEAKAELQTVRARLTELTNSAVAELVVAGRYEVLGYQTPDKPLQLSSDPNLIQSWRVIPAGGVEEVQRIDLLQEEYPELYELRARAATLQQRLDTD